MTFLRYPRVSNVDKVFGTESSKGIKSKNQKREKEGGSGRLTWVVGLNLLFYLTCHCEASKCFSFFFWRGGGGRFRMLFVKVYFLIHPSVLFRFFAFQKFCMVQSD